jgi:hypothetical protein
MDDLVMLLVLIVLVAATAGLLRLCARLEG